jgi:adenylate cyclase
MPLLSGPCELNRGLEARVAEQVDELGRVGRLKRFLAPQLAELIVSQGDEKILESHRREIVVVFCDLRGYTAFTETAEPEEVLDFLREYHGALGPLVSQFEGTLDQFSGDGIMVFFNDPVPIPDPAERAVKMTMAMREAAAKLIAAWRLHGCELGFGAGIAQGYATLGQIGFSDRSGYTAIGTVCNLAARLCAEAKDGQILVSSRIAEAVKAVARLEDLGNLELKGLKEAGRRIQRRAEHQRGGRASQFDRRREGAGGLIFRHSKVSQLLPTQQRMAAAASWRGASACDRNKSSHHSITCRRAIYAPNLLTDTIEADRYPMPRWGNAAKRRLQTDSPPSKRRPQQSLSAPTQGAGLNDEAAAQPMKQRPPFADAGVVELGLCIYLSGLGLL